MKFSEKLKIDHECGDFGAGLGGYAEIAEKLEDRIDELEEKLFSQYRYEAAGRGENEARKVYMCEFLAQFKLIDGFSVEHRNLKGVNMLDEAKYCGFAKDWEPPKGCTYYATAIITPKGRLYLKKNT